MPRFPNGVTPAAIVYSAITRPRYSSATFSCSSVWFSVTIIDQPTPATIRMKNDKRNTVESANSVTISM